MPNIIRTGSSSKKLSLSAKTTDVLTGKTFSVDGKETLVGTIPSLGATTYTPKTTDQSIASGRYLSGVQTIKGDANLVASNIASGKSIFGVTGVYEGGDYEDRTVSIPENFRNLSQYPSFTINGSSNNKALVVTSTRKIKGIEYVVKRETDGQIFAYVYYPPISNLVSKSVYQLSLSSANYVITNLDSFVMNDNYHNRYYYDYALWIDDYTVHLAIISSLLVPLTMNVRLFY